LCAPSLLSLLTIEDINQLKYIATSIRLSGDINKKYKLIDTVMASRNFKRFAGGTNRLVYTHYEVPSIVIKVAVDVQGQKDSPNEYVNQQFIKPYCCKVFEVSPCGTVGLFERVDRITSRYEFVSVADDIFDMITTKLIGKYVLEDFGTNFMFNYGIRRGFGPVILDFPYVYELDGAKLYCSSQLDNGEICEGEVDYDSGFNFLRCTKCGKIYSARDLSKPPKNGGMFIHARKRGQINMDIAIMRGNQVIKEKKYTDNTQFFKTPRKEIRTKETGPDIRKVPEVAAVYANKNTKMKDIRKEINSKNRNKPVEKRLTEEEINVKLPQVKATYCRRDVSNTSNMKGTTSTIGIPGIVVASDEESSHGLEVRAYKGNDITILAASTDNVEDIKDPLTINDFSNIVYGKISSDTSDVNEDEIKDAEDVAETMDQKTILKEIKLAWLNLYPDPAPEDVQSFFYEYSEQFEKTTDYFIAATKNGDDIDEEEYDLWNNLFGIFDAGKAIDRFYVSTRPFDRTKIHAYQSSTDLSEAKQMAILNGPGWIVFDFNENVLYENEPDAIDEGNFKPLSIHTHNFPIVTINDKTIDLRTYYFIDQKPFDKDDIQQVLAILGEEDSMRPSLNEAAQVASTLGPGYTVSDYNGNVIPMDVAVDYNGNIISMNVASIPDSSAITIIDSQTTKVLATLNCNYINSDYYDKEPTPKEVFEDTVEQAIDLSNYPIVVMNGETVDLTEYYFIDNTPFNNTDIEYFLSVLDERNVMTKDYEEAKGYADSGWIISDYEGNVLDMSELSGDIIPEDDLEPSLESSKLQIIDGDGNITGGMIDIEVDF